MAADRVKVGIIGCGNISGVYLRTMREVYGVLDVVACADLDPERARAKAGEHEGVKAVTVEELLADPEIKIVVNLTIPKAHAEVAMKAVRAGKSVYNEKPITETREQGRALLEAAASEGVLVGGAPDTFLGAGNQTCRKLVDEGAIGEPVAATAFMMCRGHETWHPDPEFFYEPGGGPMFDMGPYYLTALVNLLGPVRRVTGSTRISFPTRTITSEKKHGKIIEVQVPTHVVGVLDFASGPVATIITSFDVKAHTLPCIQVYGSEGTIQVPDPNGFAGDVLIRKSGDEEWSAVPLVHERDMQRGTGPAVMARALLKGEPPPGSSGASGELACHVLEIMHAVHEASERGRHVELASTCPRPAPMSFEGLGVE